MVSVDRESRARTPGKRLQGETYYTPEQYTRGIEEQIGRTTTDGDRWPLLYEYSSPPIPTVSLGVTSAVVSSWGMIVVKSSHSLRSHWRGMGGPMKGQRNVHHTAIHRTRRPSDPCSSIMAGVRG